MQALAGGSDTEFHQDLRECTRREHAQVDLTNIAVGRSARYTD